jgi:hypothetical protein
VVIVFPSRDLDAKGFKVGTEKQLFRARTYRISFNSNNIIHMIPECLTCIEKTSIQVAWLSCTKKQNLVDVGLAGQVYVTPQPPFQR